MNAELKPKLFTRRRILSLGLGGTALLGHTTLVEPFWLEFVERKLPVINLPDELKGKTLVQISDLHVGRTPADYLLESFQRVSDLRPDIVVYTGDFISMDENTEAGMEKTFPHLPKGTLGTAAILGNHDYGVNFAEERWARRIISELEPVGIPILRNDVLEIAGLQVVGFDDLWAGQFNPLKGFSEVDFDKATIVLTHNPDSLDEPGWAGYKGWVLAGHTHGGQCKPPFLPPPLLPVQNRRYTSGHIPLADGRDLYINRALGFLHQVRFNVRPEVTVFTLA